VLITASTDEQGRSMPSSGGGGVAYVNVFGRSDYHTRYSPALVYFDNLGGGASTYVAEASSHELGHNLGLSHDGAPGTTYYQGHGSGLVSWAPIMGNSYYNNVTQWSKGEYTGANQTQDDLAIIDAKLGTAGDDHGDSIGDATALMVGGDGSVVSSNPEFDPDNLLPENKGIIGSSADVDVFSFLSGAGAVDLVVTPAWDAFYRATTRRGANLDVQLELRDAGGAVVASSDPLNDTSASISTTVAAGTWFLAVTGVGNANTPYSDYDSLGMYFINGSVPQAVADNTAPNPNPMQFASAPVAAGENSISMTAVAATDDLGAVQYQFKCVAGGPQGCINSGWQAGESYTATGLAAATQYTFTVEARDTAGNVTDPSSPMSATTEEPPPPPPYQEFVANGETLVAGTVSGSYSATHADDNSVQSILERESGGKKNDRYTYLEHRWSFSLAQGISATAFVNAWKDGANAGESFELEYSVDGGGNWRSLLTVSSTSSGNTQVAEIPDAPSGNVLLRFVDNQQQAGNRALSTLYVDHLYIQVANTEVEPPGNPPDGDPDGFTATTASSSQINLAWTDQSSNESGYLLERSPDGTTNWVVVADLAAGTEAFSDAGRDAATQYFYRVSAYNVNGSSAYAYADATTDTPQAFNLQASGYKDKGKQKVQLDWTGDGAVDVYRDGGIVASAVSGNSYLDNIDLKGSGSYEHRVCEAGAETVCSNVTTTVF
jgi:chitodextrinase